jgi:hypothetical protein
MKARVLVLSLLGLLAARPARADVPSSITFTARILDGGDPLDGSHAMIFRLYDVETGGTPRWVENHEAVSLDDGLAVVTLGAEAPLTATVLDGDPLWVEVVLDGDAMSPRLPLRSIPYAVRTGDADRLGGQTAAAFAPAAHDHDPQYVNVTGDTMAGSLGLSGDLTFGGRSALRGTDTWLRLNQDGGFTSGIHTPYNLNARGLTVGALYYDPGDGMLDVAGFSYLRGGARLNGIAIGTPQYGALDWPYESIQLDPSWNLRFYFGTTQRMMLGSDGRLWMQTNAGDCPNGWFCNGMFWDLSVASILYSGLAQRSDARLKKDIETLPRGLETVRELRPVTFAWRDPREPGRQYGFIAQEVQRVLPDLVHENADGKLALDTQELLPVLVRAVQDLDAENRELRARIDARQRPAPDRWWLWLGLAAIVVWAFRRRR